MIIDDPKLTKAEKDVIATLRDSDTSLSPMDILTKMREKGYDDAIIRTALWYCIDRGDVILTSEFNVTVPWEV